MSMINFNNINKRNILYSILYKYVYFVHRFIFYRRFYILHRENIPKKKPVVAVSNHQNGLSDALAILFAFKKDGRYPIFIARSDIFRKKTAAKLLRFLRIMPAFRIKDSGREGLDGNDIVFNKSADILNENGVVCLFPEAGHEDCHHLGTFKKGFARIAFRAVQQNNFTQPVFILPMANHYSQYFGVGNKLIIICGEAFSFEDLYDEYLENPQKAQKMLTDRTRERVKELMLDIEDKDTYPEYDIIRTIYNEDYLRLNKLSRRYFPNSLKADKKIVADLDKIKIADMEKFDKLMSAANEYCRLLEKLHLGDWVFSRKFSFVSFIIQCILVLLLLPFTVYGFINNFIPFYSSTLVTRNVKDPMLHSSIHFVIGTLFSFPSWYLLAAVVMWITTGMWWIALLHLVSLPISLVIYVNCKMAMKKLFNSLRWFRFWFRGDRYYLRAIELRQEIVNTYSSIED